MSSLKTLGKCIGRACGLQGSEIHNVYDELKRISMLGPNTQTRKNRLASVSARLNTLRRARAEKKNLLKLNSLRLAYDVLNAQRSNAIINSTGLLQKYRALKSRRNKHETEELVESLLTKEIKPIEAIFKKAELNRYISNLSRRAAAAPPKNLTNLRKTRNVVLKQNPYFKPNRPADQEFIRKLIEERQIALLGELTNENEVSRNPQKAAAVEKLLRDRALAKLDAKEATFGKPMMLNMPLPPGMTGMPNPPSSSRRSRKTRKAGRR